MILWTEWSVLWFIYGTLRYAMATENGFQESPQKRKAFTNIKRQYQK